MAVRDALLALLTTGPAYGFQLHGGLAERTGSRRAVNVGQTYATLERLAKQRLVEPAGTTADGLPLHRLTPTGEAAATAWLSGTDASGADPWDETVDRVLIALSLPQVDSAALVAAESAKWRERRSAAVAAAAASGGPAAPADEEEEEDGTAVEDGSAQDGTAVEDGSAQDARRGLASLASRAEAVRADAMLDWLAGVESLEAGALAFEPSSTRPKRGRRPAASPAA